MSKSISKLLAWGCLGVMLISLSGCEQGLASEAPPKPSFSSQQVSPRTERVLTREERDQLSPEDVLKSLQDGNQRFVEGTLTTRNHSKLVRDASLGQHPKAVILSCLDSRIPVEDVFDRGIGDIFVARIAGNFENTDILGSMEFACKLAGSKLVFVLGHEHCGAIRGAIDNAEMGHLTSLLANIRPAVDALKDYDGEKTGSNQKFVHMVAEKNVLLTIERIRERSPILREMEEKGEIKIVGGLYDMTTGKVELLK